MRFYRWSMTQMIPIVLSFAIAAYVASLPPPIADIAKMVLPSWLVSYTPSTMAYSWFTVDRFGRVHYAWNGRYASGWTGEGAKILQFLVSGGSALIGYLSLLDFIGSTITSSYAILVTVGLGGFWGYICGYVVSRNTG